MLYLIVVYPYGSLLKKDISVWNYTEKALSLHAETTTVAMRYVTISDIAKALNLSKSTVSRALHGDFMNVSPETQELVRRKAEELGFRPNISAANLRSRSTHIIGVVIPELETSFYPTFLETAQRKLKALGYRVIFVQSNESPADERDNVNMMIDNHVDGLLVSVCDGEKNLDLYKNIINRGLPLVFFDRHVENIEAPQVLSDDYNSSFFLTEELIRHGARRIVHMKGPAGISNSADRLQGYREALDKWKIPFSDELVVDGGVSFRDGEVTAIALLEKGIKFDAIHAFTEMSLLGAKNVIQSHGIRIPQDVMIACLSGTNLCKMVYPKVTVVEQDAVGMATSAVNIIMDLIAGKPVDKSPVCLSATRIDRDSTNRRGV